MKPTPGFHYLYNLIFDSISPVNTTVPLGSIIPIKIKDIVNGEFKSFNGVISLVTRDSKGNVLDVQSISDKFTLGSIPPDDAINQLFTLNYKVPTTLSDGTYSMMVEARADGDTIWQPMRGLIGAINHFNVSVSGSSATVVNSVYGTSISASLKSISPNLHKDRRSNIVATVSNSGGDYHGAVTLAVFDANHNLVQTDAVIAEIPAGQSVSLSFVPSIKAPAGNASFVFLDHNKDSIGSASVTVLPTPAAPSLSLADSISFPDKNNVDPQNIKLSIKINNAGGIYFDKITVKYYDENKNFLNSYASYYSFDQNETKAVTFNDGNSLCVPGTKCTLSVYAQDDTGALYMIPPVDLNSIEFTIKANVPSAIGSVGTSASSIFPNPASDAVTVRNANSITGISVYSITGALVLNKAISGDSSVTLNVASLPAGSYLVRVITAAGTTVQRFIKR